MDKSRRRSLVLVGAATAATAAGITMQAYLRKPGKDIAATAELWNLPLQDLEGKPQPLTRWAGKILVVNFWATWCEPCRVEIPALVRIQDKFAAKSVQIIGIAMDSAAKVKEFAKKFKIQYPLVIGHLDSIDVTRKLGNKSAGLPYTIVLDANGMIKARHLGGIAEAQLDEAIRSLLRDVTQSRA